MLLENCSLRQFSSFWSDVSVQHLVLIDSSDCVSNKVICMYYTISVHIAQDSYDFALKFMFFNPSWVSSAPSTINMSVHKS